MNTDKESLLAPAAIRILLMEDNRTEAVVIQTLLQRPPATSRTPDGSAQPGLPPIEVEWVTHLWMGLERLSKGGLDLIVADLCLPDSDGLDTFRALNARAPEVPIVVLSGTEDEALAMSAVHEGAQDYLLKGYVGPELLSRAVRYAIERNAQKLANARHTAQLARTIELLEGGFEQLARGELRAASAPCAAGDEVCPELRRLLQSFDRMVEEVRRLNDMTALFYSTVTHDLRSPLSTLGLAARYLKDNKGTEADRAKMLEILERRTQGMLGLIDSLLDVIQLRTSQSRLDCRPVDLNELTLERVEELRPQAEARGQRLVVATLAPHPELECDPVKIGRVLQNLLSNASKYSGPGATIRVEVSEDDTTDLLCVEVLDEGPGIPADERQRIFEPFYRSRQHATGGGGHGLGLSICKGFVTAHGGDLRVASQEGKGSRFTVLLPRTPTCPQGDAGSDPRARTAGPTDESDDVHDGSLEALP